MTNVFLLGLTCLVFPNDLVCCACSHHGFSCPGAYFQLFFISACFASGYHWDVLELARFLRTTCFFPSLPFPSLLSFVSVGYLTPLFILVLSVTNA
ncbi:hypothetical protein BJV77DRAFT_1013538 [Russula vinacea]|nr:hypothetical protein BJV77DRAFT_1013538 [Russula vinacea]